MYVQINTKNLEQQRREKKRKKERGGGGSGWHQATAEQPWVSVL